MNALSKDGLTMLVLVMSQNMRGWRGGSNKKQEAEWTHAIHIATYLKLLLKLLKHSSVYRMIPLRLCFLFEPPPNLFLQLLY